MRKVFLLSIIFFLLILNKGSAQEENTISVALYSFTRYIEWPSDDPSIDFVINIIGHRSIYEKLTELTAGHKVGKRNIVVRFLETANDLSQCQLVFVGYWQSRDFNKTIEKIGKNHTLIISEKDGLIDAGSGINFIIRNNSIKFEIKRANIEKYGLIMSRELEQMAYKAY